MVTGSRRPEDRKARRLGVFSRGPNGVRGLVVIVGGIQGVFAVEPGPGSVLDQGGHVTSDSPGGQGFVLFSDDTLDMGPWRFRKAG